MYKIIGADQKEYGPISGEQIRQWIQEGRLNAASKIQVDGASEWKLVRELPEFAALLPPPPAPIAFPSAPAAPATNAMAGWALGTGIFAILCCQIFAPVSIVLGIMALSQIKQNPNQGGRGFAVAGIILGSVSLLIAVAVILIWLLIPGVFANFPNGFPH
jgi:hypothetical protein